MKIAILDAVNQDIGLKILFPDADYYINNNELDKSKSLSKFNILVNRNLENITSDRYDYLFIIIALYDAKIGTKFFKPNIKNILDKVLSIVDNNSFKKVCIFDNYDYDYDPNTIVNNPRIDCFFKRNYNKTKKYKENVVPFPYIMFGEVSIIEKLLDSRETNIDSKSRIIFTGTLFNHEDHEIGYYRNRYNVYSEIRDFIYNPGNIDYRRYLDEIYNSKFALDLNGVGDPNKRTFEILSQGSLLISEYNDLKWPFEEKFSEYTQFSSKKDFVEKITKLLNNNELYIECLKQQNAIYNKYFNLKYIKEYILENIK